MLGLRVDHPFLLPMTDIARLPFQSHLWKNLGKGEMGRSEFADKGRFGSIPPIGPI